MGHVSAEAAERVLMESGDALHVAAQRVQRALSNLDEALPGYPSSTPGASPSSGDGPSSVLVCSTCGVELGADDPQVMVEHVDKAHDRTVLAADLVLVPAVKLLPVERLATSSDPARDALRRMDRLLSSLSTQAHELYSLVTTWGFDRLQGELDLEENDEWCDSCLRLQWCELRHRGRLCRWCGDFVAAEGRRPSVDLLDAHHSGKRITRKMIEQDHPAHTAPCSKRPKGAAA